MHNDLLNRHIKFRRILYFYSEVESRQEKPFFSRELAMGKQNRKNFSHRCLEVLDSPSTEISRLCRSTDSIKVFTENRVNYWRPVCAIGFQRGAKDQLLFKMYRRTRA